VPVQLKGWDTAQPKVLVAEQAPVVSPSDVPTAQRSSYAMLEATPSAAAGQSATFGDIPVPVAATEAVEPVAPAVESLGAPAADSTDPAKKSKKSKKDKKTKDGKVKAKGKSKKAFCC
ncbi:unnamed protein product, partial [Prorocentrum cordatum]